jgi:predicted GNAT family acetyltransferase
MSLEILDVPAEHRYELRVDGEVEGVAEYQRQGEPPDERIVFTHTAVDPQHRGEGLAGELIRHALDDAVRQGLAVVPRCPYVADFIREHPAYLDAVPEAHRSQLRA